VGPDFTEAELTEADFELMRRLRTKDRPFPEPMADQAFQGIIGEIAEILSKNSEPCRESLLAQFLVALGNVIGRSVYCRQAHLLQ